ncbi:MAG: TIM barrel protein [Nanoarchaeota archaeon]|nr:TIM barrel protein [Nanoarchaeota archaeon]
MKPDRLLFGTAGIPLSCKVRDSVLGIARVKELELDAMELEFVRGVNMSLEKARDIRDENEMHKILLTAHAPYYVNLNSLEVQKIEDSIKRILDTARVAREAGAWSFTFHAGFYMKIDEDTVYKKIKKGISHVIEALEQDENDIWVRPETTGKSTQFGSYKELIKLSAEFDQVQPCIDFSHLHARSGGKVNTYEEFSDILHEVEKGLGKHALQNMHAHVSGIAYSDKGERNHLVLEQSDFNYPDLMRALKDYKACGVVVCESPNIEEDALLLKKTYESL